MNKMCVPLGLMKMLLLFQKDNIRGNVMNKLCVVKDQTRRGRADTLTQYVLFPGLDLAKFEHPDWKSIKCDTLRGVLSIGKDTILYDPDFAVAWCSKRKRRGSKSMHTSIGRSSAAQTGGPDKSTGMLAPVR